MKTSHLLLVTIVAAPAVAESFIEVATWDWNNATQDWAPLPVCQGDCEADLYGDQYCQDGLTCRLGSSAAADLAAQSTLCNGTAVSTTYYCLPSSLDGLGNTDLPDAPTTMTTTTPTETPTTPAFQFQLVDWDNFWNASKSDWDAVGLCQGDCGGNNQYCQNGLVCRFGLTDVDDEICGGSGAAALEGVSYCLPGATDNEPTAVVYEVVNWDDFWNGEDWDPIGLCQGDCTDDSYCQEDLTCRLSDFVGAVDDLCGAGALEGVLYCLPESSSGSVASDPETTETTTPKPFETIAWTWNNSTDDWSPAGNCQGNCEGNLYGNQYCEDGLVCTPGSVGLASPGCATLGAADVVDGVYYCLAAAVDNGVLMNAATLPPTPPPRLRGPPDVLAASDDSE